MPWLLLVLPWAVWLVLVPLALRGRPRLSAYVPRSDDLPPRVSVIVPARNEVTNLGACLATLLDTRYPNRQVIVVDDRSSDGTREMMHALAERCGGDLVAIEGEPLPEGWIGKSWACWQGYQAADGELLLFTDADTRHEPELLGHAVAALLREDAALLTIIPRQVLGSFWERVVMPQVLTMILARFLHIRRVNRTTNPRHVIANGQFILVRRDAYERIGGHEGVRAEVVEDLRLAQATTASGGRVFLAFALDLMQTRMYRSLAEMVEGWSKNLALGARATVKAWLRPAIPWVIAAFLLLFWVLPPALLIGAAVAPVSGGVLGWAAAATACSLAFWALALTHMRVPALYVLLYPVGALIAAALVVRSALLGSRVRWRGRSYEVGTAH